MKHNRFIKITTEHTQSELEDLVNKIPTFQVEEIKKLYQNFDCVEYINRKNRVCMYASIHENYIKDLIDLYTKLNISFNFEDITKKTLFGLEKSQDLNVEKLISRFIKNNLEVDDVLDKINELGSSSLTKKDFLVLKSV